MVKRQPKSTLGRILLLVRILVVDRRSNLAAVSLVGNDSIQCTVTVTDGDGATDSNVATVIVQNTPPVVSNVQVSPSNPLNDETLTCSATVVDPEGDPVTTTYQWQTGTGTVLGTGTTIDLSQTSVMPTDW